MFAKPQGFLTLCTHTLGLGIANHESTHTSQNKHVHSDTIMAELRTCTHLIKVNFQHIDAPQTQKPFKIKGPLLSVKLNLTSLHCVLKNTQSQQRGDNARGDS